MSFLCTIIISIICLLSYCAHSSEDQQSVVVCEKSSVNEAKYIEISYAHSPVDLLQLIQIEQFVFSRLKKYASQKKHGELELFIQNYIVDYEDSSFKVFNIFENHEEKQRSEKRILCHPLLSHRVIRRFAKYFSKVNVLLNSSDTEFSIKFLKYNEYMIWPTEKDFNNSIESVINIQDTYDYNVNEFANGNFSSKVTNQTLSAIQCHEIAEYALSVQHKYSVALDWLTVADMKRMVEDKESKFLLGALDAKNVSDLLDAIIEEHDSMWSDEPPDLGNLYTFQDKINSDYELVTRKSLFQQYYQRGMTGNEGSAKWDLLAGQKAFWALCQGKKDQSEKDLSKLFCYLESKSHPYWYINPQKIEILNSALYVIQVYDFIGPKMISMLIRESLLRLERARVLSTPHDRNSGNLEEEKEDIRGSYADSRTSMYAWLYDREYKELDYLNKRVEYLTGLKSAQSDFEIQAHQIASYATGGQFSEHIDPLEKDDRLATFMYYLSGVESGGYTAFTGLGTFARPVKGSAVFWYNRLRNGDIDYRSTHGGCPIVLGEKWVANKWIDAPPNMFRWKCSLNDKE